MNLTTKKDIFDNEFRNYFIIKSEKHFINDILNFSLKNNYIDELMIDSGMVELKNSIAKYILRNENNSGVSTIELNRKNTAKDIIYFIENYLLTLEPYEALSIILNINIDKEKTMTKEELITNSIEYCNNYREKLLNKIKLIKSISNLELEDNKDYSEQINFLEFALKGNSIFKGLTYYSPMLENKSETITSESYLYVYEKYIDSFLNEANIISKFSIDARKYILRTITKNKKDILTEQILTNICHAMLTNYILLSIYSDNPETIALTRQNYDVIQRELMLGTIDKVEVEGYIEDGPIKFSEEEIKYIKEAYIDNNIDKTTNLVHKSLFLHLAI